MDITYGQAAAHQYDAHWHVRTYDDDPEPYATYSLPDALDFAATVVGTIASLSHEDAQLHREAGEWEDSSNAYARSENQDVLRANLLALCVNADADRSRRAPVYRDERQYGATWRGSVENLFASPDNEWPEGFSLYACDDTYCRPGAWLVSTGGDFLPTKRISAHAASEYTFAFESYAATMKLAEDAFASDDDDPEWSIAGYVESMIADAERGPSEAAHTHRFQTSQGAMWFSLAFDPTAESE